MYSKFSVFYFAMEIKRNDEYFSNLLFELELYDNKNYERAIKRFYTLYRNLVISNIEVFSLSFENEEIKNNCLKLIKEKRTYSLFIDHFIENFISLFYIYSQDKLYLLDLERLSRIFDKLSFVYYDENKYDSMELYLYILKDFDNKIQSKNKEKEVNYLKNFAFLFAFMIFSIFLKEEYPFQIIIEMIAKKIFNYKMNEKNVSLYSHSFLFYNMVLAYIKEIFELENEENIFLSFYNNILNKIIMESSLD